MRFTQVTLSLFTLATVANGVAVRQIDNIQCGGYEWLGPTTCQTGYRCFCVNPYYSQCTPSAYAATASPWCASTSAMPTPTSTPTPTTTPTPRPCTSYGSTHTRNGVDDGTGVCTPVSTNTTTSTTTTTPTCVTYASTHTRNPYSDGTGNCQPHSTSTSPTARPTSGTTTH